MRKSTIGIVAVMALAAALAAPPLQAEERLTMRQDWTVYGYHAPFWWAKEKGYFREQGLDVEIKEGQGSGNTISIVGSGAEQLGFADYSTGMKAVVEGVPIKAIYGIQQVNQQAIVARSDVGIKEARDLIGKSVGLAPGEGAAAMFPAVMKVQGININQIKTVSVSTKIRNVSLLEKKVDAIVTYAAGSGMLLDQQLRKQGLHAVILRYAELGVNIPSNGILVNTRYLSSKPQAVRSFTRALQRAWQDAVRDPKEMVAIIPKLLPQYAGRDALHLAQIQDVINGLYTPNTKGKPLGWMSEKDWETAQKWMVEYGGLKATLPVAQYFTNEFIPQ
ncbi:MAG: ABC transporter substrate-binding protein [Deltaproteobacteria bacterium]|nr:ABC transporter substrate-binding protein [Deltaproteobacteria bacterium]